MGATPILALNIACLPPDLAPELVREITRGAAEKVIESGAVVAGGHTIQDPEPKVGLVAVGLAHPDRLMRKSGALPGDWLVLTKPIGTGIVATALKAGRADPIHVATAASWMKLLNEWAAQAAGKAGAKAATDITGYGFLGHAVEMAQASAVQLRFDRSSLPVLPGALEYARQGHIPGGTHDNTLYFQEWVDLPGELDPAIKALLFDAQTSGGLLVSVPGDSLATFLDGARVQEQSAWVIGHVSKGSGVQVVDKLEHLPGPVIARQVEAFEHV